MARLGSLLDEDRDWACKVFESLGANAKKKGKGMVYAIPGRGFFSQLSMLPFQTTRIIKIGSFDSGRIIKIASYDPMHKQLVLRRNRT